MAFYIDTDVAPGGTGTSGDPYSALQEFDDNEAGDLTALGEVMVYHVGATADAGGVFSTNWTNASATDFLHIQGNNQSLKRDQTKSWVSFDPDSQTYGVSCYVGYTVWEGIQFAMAANNTPVSNPICLYLVTNDNQVILNCMAYGNDTTNRIASASTGFYTTGGANGDYLINCTATRFVTAFEIKGTATGDHPAYNCLAYDCDEGFDGNFGKELLKNCIAQSCTDGYKNCTNTSNDTNNTSDIASDAPGTNSEQVTLTFVNAGWTNGDDYHLTAGDVASLGAGTDLSADAAYPFSTDGEGDARTTWYRGPDEYAFGNQLLIAQNNTGGF